MERAQAGRQKVSEHATCEQKLHRERNQMSDV